MKIYIAHSGGFDFENELYNPLKEALGKDHELFFPEEAGNSTINTKDMIKNDIDLLIAEISFPATGLGIELGRAESSNIPILCLYKKDSKFSNSIRFLTNNFIKYKNKEDMISNTGIFLKSI